MSLVRQINHLVSQSVMVRDIELSSSWSHIRMPSRSKFADQDTFVIKYFLLPDFIIEREGSFHIAKGKETK